MTVRVDIDHCIVTPGTRRRVGLMSLVCLTPRLRRLQQSEVRDIADNEVCENHRQK